MRQPPEAAGACREEEVTGSKVLEEDRAVYDMHKLLCLLQIPMFIFFKAIRNLNNVFCWTQGWPGRC